MPSTISTMWLLLAAVIVAGVDGSDGETDIDIHRDFRATIFPQQCGDTYNDVEYQMFGAFGEENCVLLRDEGYRLLSCAVEIGYFNARATFEDDGRETYVYEPLEVSYDSFWTGPISERIDFYVWDDSGSNCLVGLSEMFEYIAHYIDIATPCEDQHSEVMKALNAAFGENNCWTNLDTDNGKTIESYDCETFWEFPGYHENVFIDYVARANYKYLPDENDKPILLDVIYESDQCLSYNRATEATDFFSFCLEDFTLFPGIQQRINFEEIPKCGEDHDYVLGIINAVFGEENCSSLLADDRVSTTYYCQTTADYIEGGDIMITFDATVEYTYTSFHKDLKRSLEIEYGDVLMGRKSQATDFLSYNCIDAFDNAFETIRRFSYCHDKHDEIIAELHLAFGEENCSSEDGESPGWTWYVCDIDFGDLLSARAIYSYRPHQNDKPFSLWAIYTAFDGGISWYGDEKFTDFSPTPTSCLDDFGSLFSFITQRTKQKGKCREIHGYVLTAMNVAFGEENCSALPTADSDSENYSCQVTSEGFNASGEYTYIRSSEYEPRNLQFQYEEIGMDMKSLATNFTSTCLDNNEFVAAFRTIRGYTFDSCSEPHADILDKLTAIFGNGQCNEYGEIMDVVYGDQYGLETKTGLLCATRDIHGFYAYAEYMFDRYDKNQPKTLKVSHTGAEEMSTDLSNSGGCLITFADMFETIGNEIAANICTNSDQPVLMFTPKYGERKETSCKILGKRKKPRKLKRLCRGDQELSRMCPGLCRMKRECACYNNPYEFKAKDVEGNKTKITCDALMGMSVAERKLLCNRRKIKYNCPGICKQRCASSVWNESDGDKVVLS